MEERAKPSVDWERLDRATIEADRLEFRRTTVRDRVELQIQLSRELTRLAARGADKAK